MGRTAAEKWAAQKLEARKREELREKRRKGKAAIAEEHRHNRSLVGEALSDTWEATASGTWDAVKDAACQSVSGLWKWGRHR